MEGCTYNGYRFGHVEVIAEFELGEDEGGDSADNQRIEADDGNLVEDGINGVEPLRFVDLEILFFHKALF